MDSIATISVKKGKSTANNRPDDTSRNLENGEPVKSYHLSSSFEVQADDKVMPNRKKEQSRASLPSSGNRYEVLGDDELMQNDDIQEQSGGDKTEGGSKSAELLNGNGLSAKVVESSLRKTRLKSADGSEFKKLRARVPIDNCSFEEFFGWIGKKTKGMNHDEFIAFKNSLYPEDVPKEIPEDNQYRRIEGLHYVITYPPPYLRGGKGPDLAKFFKGKELTQLARDIIEDKKTYYIVRDGKQIN